MNFDARRNRTKRPCPLWVDAFQRDTMHLGADEVGAYLLILMAMWMRPECNLPDDDCRMARVCRVSLRLWKARIGPVIRPFLLTQEGMLYSKRLSQEAAYVEGQLTEQHNRRVGKKSGAYAKPQGNNNASGVNVEKTDNPLKDNGCGGTVDTTTDKPRHPPSYNLQPTVKTDGGDGSARDAILPVSQADEPTDRELILAAIGVDPVSGLTGRGGAMLGKAGDMAEAAQWLELPGLTMPLVCDEIRRIMAVKRDGPPKSFRYFTEAMQRLSGAMTLPPLQPIAPATGPPARPPATVHLFDLSKFKE